MKYLADNLYQYLSTPNISDDQSLSFKIHYIDLDYHIGMPVDKNAQVKKSYSAKRDIPREK